MQLLVALLVLGASIGATVMALPSPLASPPCVACSVDGESVFGRYSRDERDALMAGRIVTDAAADHAGVDGAEATTVAVAGIIRQPAAQVWATLVDFPSRPRFQPGTKDVQVVRIDGDQVWLAQHLQFFFVDIRYTVIDTLDPVSGRIGVVLDETAPHDIGDTRGSWQVVPLTGGRETLLSYRAWIDPGRHLSVVLQRFLLRRSLPELISGLRDEVERRARTP